MRERRREVHWQGSEMKLKGVPYMEKEDTRKLVRDAYGKIAREGGRSGGCGCSLEKAGFAKSIGYTDEELKNVPADAQMSLGCGNPASLAGLKEGETVLDLGSGAGFDCFVASARVGSRGRIIGVDMTPEMIEKARNNAERNGIRNVEFRLAEIESLPIGDSSVDVIISNCVINLSPEKQKVYQEAYRVLKPGGRLAISDIALIRELPEKVHRSLEAYTGCIAGAMLVHEYKRIVESSGFHDVKISLKNTGSCMASQTSDPLGRAIVERLGDDISFLDDVVSVSIEGYK